MNTHFVAPDFRAIRRGIRMLVVTEKHSTDAIYRLLVLDVKLQIQDNHLSMLHKLQIFKRCLSSYRVSLTMTHTYTIRSDFV